MESSPATASQRISLGLQLLNLKFLFLGHVAIASWIMMMGPGGTAYLFHTSVLVMLIFYGIHFRENPEPLFLAVCVESLAFVLDLFLIAFYARWFLSVMMILIHMIFRVVAGVVLLREHQVRGGPIVQSALRGVIVEGNASYDDIDQRSQPHIPVPRHTTDMGNH
ncbi:uncharacterized protein LOC100898127 [Galendromus occidentalis]|uniref:Uncharacterized protein LOC100898127 n=1 Tax=Galendromus occidentalis TaxID=34638 RepID=A0AAJ6QTZ0_9ACAR|nr:uncharacterized protein LOC100898127 [Galendromus occidentalis]